MHIKLLNKSIWIPKASFKFYFVPQASDVHNEQEQAFKCIWLATG